MTTRNSTIARHKTAIRRPGYSLPIQCLLRDGLVQAGVSVFDYGCGHGQDMELLRATGIECDGWDPAFCPDGERRPADVVNVGYVINVIEDAPERSKVVQAAWELSKRVLVVSAQVKAPSCDEHTAYADGIVTSRATFQKYYTQSELRTFLENELCADAIPAAPGVFYLFKHECAKQEFLATRYHRRIAVPSKRIAAIRFDQHRDVLEPMMATLAQLGRLPGPEEFFQFAEVVERFGSMAKAFTLIQRVTDEQPWEDIADRRTEDLLVYLALSRFQRRPPLSRLPLSIQRDIKAFLGSYRSVCARADVLLFRAGDPTAIDTACQRAEVGKLVDNALIIHRDGLDHLSPLLRIYEGCARALVGDIDEATLIKLHRFSGKVSYLAYPGFEKVAHPALCLRVKVTLPTLAIDFFDYSDWADPPLLFRKEEFLHREHPLRERFSRLTAQEDNRGLLDQIDDSAPASRWQMRLTKSGCVLRGHRIVRATE